MSEHNNIDGSQASEDMLKKAKEELEIQAWGLRKANDGIKILYKELEAKNRELQKLDQLKDDFISTVSHELRTPLAITKEGLSLMLDKIPGEINAKQEKIITIAKDNIDRLARLINNLLDISKIESGKIILKRKIININRLIESVASSFMSQAEAKGLEIDTNLPDTAIETYADYDKLMQVFTNMMGNAMKFTEKGCIKLSLKDQGPELECEVSDTGRGISREDLTKVFGKFEQFGRVAGAGEKGTGLGLSISKGIVELHKGRIWVESEIGKGTQFIFTLPKYNKELLLEEFVNYGLEKVKRGGSRIALIMISIRYPNKVSQKHADSVDKTLAHMEDIIESALRRTEDLVLRGEGYFSALLIDCDKDNARNIGERIEKAFNSYLTKEGLADEIKLKLGYSVYPDEAKTIKELINKARSL